jgi:hypothetical protein
MNPNIPTSSEEPDEQLQDQIEDMTARFPEVHHLSDCIESVRLAGGIFARILGRSADPTPLGGTLERTVAGAEPTYSVVDAEKISKKLRQLAGYRGVNPILNTWGLVLRLAPELVALIEQGYSYEDVGETLMAIGVDIRPLLARRR